MSLSTSDFGGDGFRLRNFRHGEAPWQERELRTIVPLTLEVERNRGASTPLLKFPGHQYLSLRSQFGCSIVGVDRQGYPVPSPGPDTELFPGDELLVLGTATQIQHVRAFFDSSPTRTEHVDLLDEIRLGSVEQTDNIGSGPD